MQAHFMLDTNILILVRKGHTRVVTRVAELVSGLAVMSVVTFGELRLGAEKSRNRDVALKQLGELATGIEVLALSREAAVEYSLIRVDLERRGQVIGPNDLWIAAQARSAGLTLVTNNEDEFRRVPGLSVENWAIAP